MLKIKDLTGQQVNGYQIEELLITRKLTHLYRALDIGLGEPVFIEILIVLPEDDPDLNERFLRNMQELKNIEHDNIARIIATGKTTGKQGHSYAVIEYIPGLFLKDRLEEWRASNNFPSPQDSLLIIRQLTNAISEIHSKSLIHEGLTPTNIIFRDNETPIIYDLGDPYLGAATKPNQSLIYLDYASPEELQGQGLDRRSNIYSLGVILYEFLAGNRPELPESSWDIFDRTTIPKEISLEDVLPDLCDETYTVVSTCLWRQEWGRFQTADELTQAVDEALYAENFRVLRPMRKQWNTRWLYGVMTAVLAVVVLIIVFFSRQESPANDLIFITETAVIPTTSTLVFATEEHLEEEIVPTATPELEDNTITLLAPPPEYELFDFDSILFDWYSSVPLELDQQFSIYLVSDNQEKLLGTVNAPVTASQYRFIIEIADIGLELGEYDWFITLDSSMTGEVLTMSERQSFAIKDIPDLVTPTLTATSIVADSTIGTSTPTMLCTPFPPSHWVAYTVRQTDYLFNLALATGTTVERIQEVNCLDGPTLSIGMNLWLPLLPATETPTPEPTSAEPTQTSGSSNGSSGQDPTRTPPPPP